MAKLDLDSLGIEELCALRDNVAAKLAEKVAARQLELQAEMDKLSQYDKPSKKSAGAPAAKAKKSDTKKNEVPPAEPIAEAA
jgi:hypothetical protein